MAYRFVQLSDIHFGQESGGTLVVHEDVRRMLLKDAADLAASHGAADLVLIAGDIAFGGTQAEYKRAGEWVDELTSAVKCGETDVRVVPGNHDCDRSQLSRVALSVHRSIRGCSLDEAYVDLADMWGRAEEANPLLPKLKAYRDFAAGYDSDFDSGTAPLWTKDFLLAPGVVFRFVGMNSVQVSDKDDGPGKMILGNAQYIFPPEPHVICAVVMHHPLHWFMDKAQAEQYLHNRAQIILTGHEHVSKIGKTIDAVNGERLEICSGATNPPESGGLYRFSYNWIEIELREKQASRVLVVNVRPRVWVAERARFAADTQRLAGSESADFEISCPELKPKSNRNDAVSSPAATSVTTTASTSGPQPSPFQSVIGGTMAGDDEATLAKLKFLFWRYLDWQQRIKVLVQADALPPSADRPVPQTMERLALENARQQGKLAAVWDAMQEHLPEAKRQTNPFRKGTS